MHARALALALFLLAPAVAADETFHYAPAGVLTLEPGDLREPLSGGVSVCAVACVQHVVENGHESTLKAAGNGRPVHSHFWIEVVAPTAGPASVQPVLYACPLSVFVQVLASNGESKWYWSLCVGLDELGVAATPGIHEVDIDWPADYSDVEFAPGDTLFASVWTASSSMPEAPTIYLLGDEEHPSSFLFSGYTEPKPEPEPAPQPTNKTASSTVAPKPSPDPKPKGNGTTSPPRPQPDQPAEPVPEPTPTTQAPAPKQEPAEASAAAVQSALLLLGVLAVARRRLA